jgi:hypothetical protein
MHAKTILHDKAYRFSYQKQGLFISSLCTYMYSKKDESLFKYKTVPSIVLIHKFPVWNAVYKISACDVKDYWLRYKMELFKMSKVHSYGESITILRVVFNILFYTDPYKYHRKENSCVVQRCSVINAH